MFLLNRNHEWTYDHQTNLKGFIINPSSIDSYQLTKRINKGKLPKKTFLLFDPQLYYPASFFEDKSRSVMINLSAYPWFHEKYPRPTESMNVNAYRNLLLEKNSSAYVKSPESEEQIKSAVSSVIDFQNQIRTTHLILPTPTISSTSDFLQFQKWVKLNQSIVKSNKKHKFVTIALSEDFFLNHEGKADQSLGSLITYLKNIKDIHGYYFVLTSSRKSRYKPIEHPKIITAILELSYHLGHKAKRTVILNYIDQLGFLGLSLGASAFSSGYYAKEKRLNYSDYHAYRGFGGYPKFYSFTLINDLSVKRHVLKAYMSYAYPYLKADATHHSKDLFQAIDKRPKNPKTPEPWQQIRNKTKAAKEHRFLLMRKRAQFINSMSPKDRVRFTYNWLKDAKGFNHAINTLIPLKKNRLPTNHIDVWFNCYETFIQKYHLL